MKIHLRDIRLRNNAGMDFPQCYVTTANLDIDKSRLPTTGDPKKVTCKRCLRYLNTPPWWKKEI
jgi:hypothetical protein